MPDETNATADEVDAVAATVVLLRAGARGLEVLLLERPSDRGSFAGAWVFPGGVVDPGDVAVAASSSERAAATVAGVRETREETGLVLVAEQLVATACWVPPAGIPKRVRTWFFLAPAPVGEVTLSPDESVDFRWVRPADALARHADGGMRLFPPTWVTLHGIVPYGSVEEAVRDARDRDIAWFRSRFAADRRTIYWESDVAHADDARAAEPGPRHRLEIGTLPWTYLRDPASETSRASRRP